MDQPKFKKLQDKWYSKLKRSGFKDIEQDDGHLKDYSFNIAKGSAVRVHHDIVSARFEYYSACRAFLTNHHFTGSQWARDKKIWELHTEGVSINAIAGQVKIDRRRVRQTITELETKMKGENK